jgi:hypothetical protein
MESGVKLPRFYTRKSQVPLGEGQTLGFQPGRGYYAKGAAKDPLLTRAQEYAETVLSPSLEAIRAERAEAERMAQQRAQAMAGYNQAAAQMLQSIGPQVQQGYAGAAGRTANFGKGYSVGMQISQQGAADEANRLLAMNGAPQGQQQTVTSDAADVLYGTGGVIPATSLEREGAAFGAAASQLPATQLGMGRVSLQALMEKAAEEQRDFDRAVREIESKRPGVVQEALADLKDQEMKTRAQRLNERIAEQELGLKFESASQGRARLAQGQQRLNQQARNDLARLDLSAANYQLAVQREQRLSRGKGKGGFTPKQRADLQKRAGELAKQLYWGEQPKRKYVAKNPPGQRWVKVPGTEIEGVGYWEAMKELLNAGIPYSMARKTLNRLYKPGEDGRPGGKKKKGGKKASDLFPF